MIAQYGVIFSLAWLGGYLFSLLHLPLPWTLGPLVTTVILKVGFHWNIRWPMKFRNNAMLILGYVMGSPFTPETGRHILHQLPLMTILTLITIALCLASGYIIYRYTEIDLATSLLGSMPGGLTQMVFVCEEVEGTDPAAVVLMQTLRVVTVVFIVPFLVLHGLADKVEVVARETVWLRLDDIPVLALFGTAILATVFFAKRVKLSSPYLFAPILATAALVLGGIHPPTLPPFLVAIAQVSVGIRMGMSVSVESLTEQKRVFIFNLISLLIVIAAFLGIDKLIANYYPIDFVTAFISTAPGGMTEMGLTALMVHADLSTVVAFQIFRLMFVLMIAVPVLKWWLCVRCNPEVSNR